MVTLQNYSEKTANINFAKEPDHIKEAHKDFANYAEFYNEDKDIKEMLDNHMKLVNDIIKKEYAKQSSSKQPKSAKKTTKPTRKTVVKKAASQKKDEKCNKVEPIKTEHYTEDVRLIRRFAGCIGKERQRRTILTIYRDFERRITERKVSRMSKHAALVAECSKKLAAILDAMAKQKLTHATMELDEKFSKKVMAASKELAIRTSVNLLKRFVGVEGETKPDKAKVQRIMDAYERAQTQNKLTKDDFYAAEIKASWKAMKEYINGKSDYVAIESTALSGLDNVFCVGKPKATATLSGSGEETERKKPYNLLSVNKTFNSDIDLYIKKEHKGHEFNLGLPSKVLIDSGLEKLPITLTKRTLTLKIKKHKFNAELLTNLPKKIARPLFVFDSKIESDKEFGVSKIVVVGGSVPNEGILSVVISKESHNTYVINKVNSVGGRKLAQIWDYISNNLLKYADKDKVLKHLPEASIASDSNCQDFITKIQQHLGIASNNLSGLDSQSDQVREQLGFEPSVQEEPVVVSSFSVDLEPEVSATVQGIEDTGDKEEVKSELFTPITAEIADNGQSKIELPTDLGKFLGYVERYEYSILLRGEKGAGKSRLTYQMMNVFAKAGFSVGCFSLEIGKQSNIVKDMRDTYISPTIADRVQIADSAPNGLDDIKAAAKIFDVVCIDSWGKIPNIKSDDFDKLRKEFPETMFIIIFQSTTNGTARGGSAPEYDAGIVIQVQAGGRAICEKNRYSGDDLTYLVFERRLEDKMVG